jgi:hypothetical protein
LAEAQQQLFPNMTIKRQRVSPVSEPPVYGLYRAQYYGHYPTCWRLFPAGWGCPNPDAANAAKVMDELNKQVEKLQGAAGRAEPAEGAMPPERAEPTLPPLPNEPSPFEERPMNAPPREREAPAQPPAGVEDRPAAPPGDSAARGSVPSRPERAAVLEPIDPNTPPPLETVAATSATSPPAVPPMPTSPVPPLGAATDIPVRLPAGVAPAAVTASPPRRTLIGGLFDSLLGRTRR